MFPPAGLGEGHRRHDEDLLVLPTAYRQDIPTQGKYPSPAVQVLESQPIDENIFSETSTGEVLDEKTCSSHAVVGKESYR